MAPSDHANLGQLAAPASANRRDVLRLGAVGVALAACGLPTFTAAPASAAAAPRPGQPDLVPDAVATKLWYTAPATLAKILQQGLPIGNGRIGALVTGDPASDALYLSDVTLWTGGVNDTLDSGGQFPYGSDDFGTASLLAKAYVEVPAHDSSSVSGYRRELDLSNGIVRASYVVGGVTYRRTAYASHVDDVVVVHLTQDGGGSYAGRVRLDGTHGETTSARTGEAYFQAALANGLRYAATVTAVTRGGSVGTSAGAVTFAGADEVVVVFSGGTNYAPSFATGYRDPKADPLQIARSRTAAAAVLTAGQLLAGQVADYRRVAESQTIVLEGSTAAQRAMDTPSRLAARAPADAAPDPELEASYLKFGRYLTITGSRTSLPINLQGPWLENNSPPWMADYHTDINLQMNYWLTDRARLTECFDALTDYCLSQYPSWKKITLETFQDPRNGFRNSNGVVAGWTVAISTNVHGGNGWWWNPTGSAWLVNTLMSHYEFTLDIAFLARIYPLLKDACEFWRARLITITVTDPVTGQSREELVDDADWSAEQGPTDAKGITYAQELVWQLFANLQTASRDLARDASYAATIKGLQDRLHLPAVSRTTGWLQEWMTDDNLGETTHRHLSPLVGLFPGDRINTLDSPADIVTGATNLLRARGMTSFGWSMAWRGLCWARLKNSTRAYRSVLNVMKPADGTNNGSAVNFFDMYQAGGYVFQIDANLGTPSAMYEMLVYSRPGHIELLPASPAAWDTGSVTSLGARGGFTVDLHWKGRQVTSATIHSVGGKETTVHYGAWQQTIRVTPGRSVTLTPPPREYHDEPEEIAYSLVNKASGKAMDDPGASKTPGTRMIQWDASGAANQLWVKSDAGDGRFHLTNVASALLAEIGGGTTAPGAYVTQWTDTGGDSQMWRVVDAGDGWSKVVNARSGLLLSVEGQSTADGANLVQLADTGHPSQLWKLLS